MVQNHLKECEGCRGILASITSAEKDLRKNVEISLSGISVKDRSMKVVRDLKRPDPVAVKNVKKSPWFYILAPGLAVIFFVALFTAVKPTVKNSFVVSCHASGADSHFNGIFAQTGKEIDFQPFLARKKRFLQSQF